MNVLKSVKSIPKYVEEDENFWMEHLLKFSESGLSRAEYCRKAGINRDRFRYWKKRLENKKLEMLVEKSGVPKINKLIPVEIKEGSVKEGLSLCSMKLRNGLILQIHAWSVVEKILLGV